MATRRSFLMTPLTALAAQQQPFVPKQTDRPEPLAAGEEGFAAIFDGKSLHGWDGDPKYWRIDDGAMTGEITPETILKSNTFIVYRGPTPDDFELKTEYRITAAGNSGINYRSAIVEDKVTATNRFAMRGYQCDIDGRNRYTGNNYEEKGRLFLAERGQLTHVTGVRKPVILASLGDNQALARLVTGEWNQVHLIIRGNTLYHIINGALMSAVIDDDPNRQRSGLIGVQVHVGPPMKVQYRNWRLKKL